MSSSQLLWRWPSSRALGSSYSSGSYGVEQEGISVDGVRTMHETAAPHRRRAPEPVGSKFSQGTRKCSEPLARQYVSHPCARARSLGIVGRSPMSRDEDGISNSFWLLFASLLTSVAIGV